MIDQNYLEKRNTNFNYSPDKSILNQKDYHNLSTIGIQKNYRQGSNLWNWQNYMNQTLRQQSIQKNNTFKPQEKPQEDIVPLSNNNPQIVQNNTRLSRNSKQSYQQNVSEHGQSNCQSQNQKVTNENLDCGLMKIDSEVRIRRNFQWKVSSGILKVGEIMFFITHYKISQISKLKIMTEAIDETEFHTIRFHYDNEIIYFGAPIDNYSNKISYHFAWFIGIIVRKLNYQRWVNRPIFKQKKGVKLNGHNDCKYSGPIYKKSQYLGKWCERWVVVSDKGLFFYNLQNNTEDYSFCISADNIKYIWTRFEILNNSLVLKVKHGLRKTQLAFPIVELFQQKYSWLLELYNLMMFRKQ